MESRLALAEPSLSPPTPNRPRMALLHPGPTLARQGTTRIDMCHDQYVIVAPDKFKGTLTAAEVSTALATGIREARRQVIELPAADGGEGTSAILRAARGGETLETMVEDPLGRPISATFAWLPADDTAVVDAAAASGLTHLSSRELDPWTASTKGTGQLIAAASTRARNVIVAPGGTATVDGGLGAIDVLKTLNAVPRLIVACDVQTTWDQASEIFGPQKGADRAQVMALKARLDSLAKQLDRDPRGVPMTGCGGGLSGGLWAAFGATLASGADLVLDALDFDVKLASAALVITGEGQLDEQTEKGKLVSAISRRCHKAKVPCIAVVGKDAAPSSMKRRLGLTDVLVAGTKEELRLVGHEIGASTRPTLHA